MIDDPMQQTQERDKYEEKKTKKIQLTDTADAVKKKNEKQKVPLTDTADSKARSTGSRSNAALATALCLWESESFLQLYDLDIIFCHLKHPWPWSWCLDGAKIIDLWSKRLYFRRWQDNRRSWTWRFGIRSELIKMKNNSLHWVFVKSLSCRMSPSSSINIYSLTFFLSGRSRLGQTCRCFFLWYLVFCVQLRWLEINRWALIIYPCFWIIVEAIVLWANIFHLEFLWCFVKHWYFESLWCWSQWAWCWTATWAIAMWRRRPHRKSRVAISKRKQTMNCLQNIA